MGIGVTRTGKRADRCAGLAHPTSVAKVAVVNSRREIGVPSCP